MKKLIIILLIAVLTLSFAACKEDTESPATSDNVPVAESKGATSPGVIRVDFGWIQLDIPDYYVEIKESERYITVGNKNDHRQCVRIMCDYLADFTVDILILEQISNNPEKYSRGYDANFSGFAWQTVNYAENGADCRMFFAQAGDGAHFIKLTALGLNENDFELQVILGAITLDLDKL